MFPYWFSVQMTYPVCKGCTEVPFYYYIIIYFSLQICQYLFNIFRCSKVGYICIYDLYLLDELKEVSDLEHTRIPHREQCYKVKHTFEHLFQHSIFFNRRVRNQNRKVGFLEHLSGSVSRLAGDFGLGPDLMGGKSKSHWGSALSGESI